MSIFIMQFFSAFENNFSFLSPHIVPIFQKYNIVPIFVFSTYITSHHNNPPRGKKQPPRIGFSQGTLRYRKVKQLPFFFNYLKWLYWLLGTLLLWRSYLLVYYLSLSYYSHLIFVDIYTLYLIWLKTSPLFPSWSLFQESLIATPLPCLYQSL